MPYASSLVSRGCETRIANPEERLLLLLLSTESILSEAAAVSGRLYRFPVVWQSMDTAGTAMETASSPASLTHSLLYRYLVESLQKFLRLSFPFQAKAEVKKKIFYILLLYEWYSDLLNLLATNINWVICSLP